MRKITASILLLGVAVWLTAQVPAGYYDSAKGKSAKELKTALHLIIREGNRLSYGSGSGKTWSGFEQSDLHPDGYVWDMYSLNKRYFPGGASVPGGMNIEHSVAKSWWGGTNNDAYKDLYHLNPSDVSANSARSNYPLGINQGSKFNNGSIKVGNNSYGTEYSGLCFEPLDEYKGDFARAYMYMFTCYENFTWSGTSAPSMLVAKETWPMLRPWAKNMLLEWHKKDPVSVKERNRMAAIFKIQHNRNPYIDYPELADFIWGASSSGGWYPGAEVTEPEPENPDTVAKFMALPATGVAEKQFTANWTTAGNTTSYLLNVYTIRSTGTTEPVSIAGADLGDGIPAGWSTTGYTDTQTSGSLRLASGSNPGTLVSGELDLSANNLILTVKARQYSNDTGATLSVAVDGALVAEWNTEKTNREFTVELPKSTETSVITFSAKSNRRVYIDAIQVTGSTLSYENLSLPGFPVTVSEGLSYTVDGLEPGNVYYYTLTTVGSKEVTSNVVPVETRVISSNSGMQTGNIILTQKSGELYVDFMETETELTITDGSGKKVYSRRGMTGAHTIPLRVSGLYLIRINNDTHTTTYKQIVY